MGTDRLLELSLLLLNNEKLSCRELAARLEVSERTVFRDIESLSLAGFPVVAYQGRGGGFGLVEGYKVDRQLLMPGELSALSSAMESLSRAFGDRGFAILAEKLRSLGPETATKTRSPLDYLRLELDPGGRLSGKLCELRRALEGNRLLRLRYVNPEGRQSERVVEPLLLSFDIQVWYLHAYCRLRSDFRLFKVARMREIEVLPQGFEPRPYSPEGVFEPDEGTVETILRFSEKARALAEDYYGPDELEYEDEGSVIARMRVPINDWLVRFVLGYGAEVEVVAPQALSDALREKEDALFARRGLRPSPACAPRPGDSTTGGTRRER
jgi:predicted DNA-binding transcriptional regulator YafY